MIAWLERFRNLDRRWIFLGMAIAIVIPMLVPVTFAFRVDEYTKKDNFFSPLTGNKDS